MRVAEQLQYLYLTTYLLSHVQAVWVESGWGEGVRGVYGVMSVWVCVRVCVCVYVRVCVWVGGWGRGCGVGEGRVCVWCGVRACVRVGVWSVCGDRMTHIHVLAAYTWTILRTNKHLTF